MFVLCRIRKVIAALQLSYCHRTEQNRIIEYLSWKGPAMIISSYCLIGPGLTKLKSVIKGFFQTPLKHRQPWSIDRFLGSPFQFLPCSIVRWLGNIQTILRDEYHNISLQSSSVCQLSK